MKPFSLVPLWALLLWTAVGNGCAERIAPEADPNPESIPFYQPSPEVPNHDSTEML